MSMGRVEAREAGDGFECCHGDEGHRSPGPEPKRD